MWSTGLQGAQAPVAAARELSSWRLAEDKSTGKLVRWRVGQDALEFIGKGDHTWTLTEPNSEYEKAFYDGTGQCELEMLEDKAAHKILDSWGIEKPYGE